MRFTWNRLMAAWLALALVAVPSASFSQNAPFPLQQTQTLQAAAVALGNGTLFPVGQMGVVTLQVSGTLTSLTVSFEATNDGTNFVAMTCYTLDSNTSATSTTAVGIWKCNVAGLAAIRARVSTYSSGTVTVTANGSSLNQAVRDTLTPSGAITGQLRGSQTTAPTCGMANMQGAMGPTTDCLITGTDSFMVGGLNGSHATGGLQSQTNLVITFNAAYAAAPTCLAQYNANSFNGNTVAATAGYAYYFYAVTPTTTTVTLKLGKGGGVGMLTPAAAAWSPFDTFNVQCAGIQ